MCIKMKEYAYALLITDISTCLLIVHQGYLESLIVNALPDQHAQEMTDWLTQEKNAASNADACMAASFKWWLAD